MYLRLFFSVNFFLIVSFGYSQKDSLHLFYQVNNNLQIEKFEREHIPLDGETAVIIPKRVDELYGFVLNGEPDKWHIEPEYEQVFAVYKDLAIVKKGYGYCIINSNNKKLTECSYVNIFKENENIFRATSNRAKDSLYINLPDYYQYTYRNTYLDNSGNFKFNEFCHDFRGFNKVDSLAWFRKDRLFTIRGVSGKIHRQITYNKNRLFKGISNNKLIYQERFNNEYLYTGYDIKGEVAFRLPLNYGNAESIHQLGDHFFGIIYNGNDYAFCNEKGDDLPYDLVFTEHYSVLQPSNPFYTQNVFIVQHTETGQFGLLSSNGTLISECKFKFIEQFVNDEAFAIDSNDKAVLIDKKGMVLSKFSMRLPLQFLRDFSTLIEPYGFYDGLAIGTKAKIFEEKRNGELVQFAVQDSNIFYYYNIKEDVNLELHSNVIFVGNFSEGLAPVITSSGKLGFINKKGKWIIAPKYEAQLAGGYPIPYLVLPKFKNGFAYLKAFKGYIDKDGNEYFSGKKVKDKYNFSH
jgi:hypothetical protein